MGEGMRSGRISGAIRGRGQREFDPGTPGTHQGTIGPLISQLEAIENYGSGGPWRTRTSNQGIMSTPIPESIASKAEEG